MPNFKLIGSTHRNKQKGLNKNELKNYLFHSLIKQKLITLI